MINSLEDRLAINISEEVNVIAEFPEKQYANETINEQILNVENIVTDNVEIEFTENINENDDHIKINNNSVGAVISNETAILSNIFENSPINENISYLLKTDNSNNIMEYEEQSDKNDSYKNDNMENKSVKQISWTDSGKLCYKVINPSTKIANNYLRGCLWSPDGTCLLTNSNDNIMRIYELPRDSYDMNLYQKPHQPAELNPVLSMKEIDLIYDYCWYPFMNSNNPDTCLFASTSRKGSVRLWDAYHGTERGHIQPYDHLVEPVSAQSIAFSRDGLKLYCGFDRCVRVFDINRLSNSSERRPRLGTKSELRGIISCIATSIVNIGMYACGSYSKDAAIFHEQSGERILEFLRTDDRIGGITHIEFSPVDLNCVVTGGRIDDALHVWDLRSLGSPVYRTAKRDVKTNQKIYFQFDQSGRFILSGNHNGNVSVFSVYGETSEEDDYLLPKAKEWRAHSDVCNGISLHPSLPLLATTSGQRRLTPPWRRSAMITSSEGGAGSDEDSVWSSDDEAEEKAQENEVRIWSLPMITENENK